MNKTSDAITLIDLLTDNTVIVPMLQRDYVQGRKKGKSIIGEDFVKTIIDTLATANKKLHLDFIFSNKKDDELKLIDGQQRITTLFLMYTYLSHRTGNISNDKTLLQNFSYATRVSSKDFCKYLTEQQIDFNIIGKKENDFSNYIKDCSWYSAKWDNDPTISSMIVVLNEIHNKIRELSVDTEKAYQNIKKITFENIEMQIHQLDEGTYLRMNGRGKPLDDFEKMKADIIKAIQQNEKYSEPNSTEAILGINNDNNAYKKLTDYISFKLDTDWLEIFWGLDSGEFKKYNDYYRNFLNAIIYALALKSIDANDEKNTTMEELQIQYSVLNGKKNINFLVESLNTLKEICDKDKTLLNKIFTFKENGITRFKDNNYNVFIKNNEPIDRIYLYAILKYLIDVNTTLDNNMQDYIRVVRNLLTNSNSYEKIVEIINYINNKNNENIYKILNNENFQKEFPKFDALLNEIEKAKLIVKNDKINNEIRIAIHSIEDNDTIVCANTNNLIEFIKAGGDNLLEWANTFNAIFSDDFLGNKNEREERNSTYRKNEITLIRALLAFGQYFHKHTGRIVAFGYHYNTANLDWHTILINQKSEENKYSDLAKSLSGLFQNIKHNLNSDLSKILQNSIVFNENQHLYSSWESLAMLHCGEYLLSDAILKDAYNNCNTISLTNKYSDDNSIWKMCFSNLSSGCSQIASQGKAFHAEVYCYSLYTKLNDKYKNLHKSENGSISLELRFQNKKKIIIDFNYYWKRWRLRLMPAYLTDYVVGFLNEKSQSTLIKALNIVKEESQKNEIRLEPQKNDNFIDFGERIINVLADDEFAKSIDSF